MPDLDDLLLDAFSDRLRETGRLLRAAVERRLKPIGLTYLQWAVLIHLARQGDGVVQKDLSGALGIDGPTLVGVLDRLVTAGLVERREVAQDRRFKAVHLTPHADAVILVGEAAVRDIHRQALAGANAREVEGGLSLLRRIAASVGFALDDAPPEEAVPPPGAVAREARVRGNG